MDDWDDEIAQRLAALDVLDPPDLWPAIVHERERLVPVVPLRRRRRALPVVIAGGVAAAGVAFVVATTTLSTDDPVPPVPATDAPVSTAVDDAVAVDPLEALQISITETVRREGSLRIEFELDYTAPGEEILPQWFVLEPVTDTPEPDGFADGSVFGCLPAEGDLARLKVGYSVAGGVADVEDCLSDSNGDGLWEIGSYRLVPGAHSSIAWTIDAPPPGRYRLGFAGWSSPAVSIDLGFAPLGLDPLPTGYSLEWARYEGSTGQFSVGLVRYEGSSGSPALQLILRPRGSGWLAAVPADRQRWTVDGRTVVDDSVSPDGCSTDACSVSLDWDDGTNMSLSWEAGEDAGYVLPASATAESLVALVPMIIEIDPTEFVDGRLSGD